MSVKAWEQFVIDFGAFTPVDDLAHILGVPAEDIRRLRSTGACGSQGKRRHSFAELVQLWWGRPADDADWPAPRKVKAHRGHYRWEPPELGLLARLVGQLTPRQIAEVLTQRLQVITGDRAASRNAGAVQNQVSRLGMMSGEALGGLSTAQAAQECGSSAAVYQAIERGELKPRRLGRRYVIDRAEWDAFKASRVMAPPGFVQLSTIREALGIRSDKLSEFARMGHVPTAIRCNPTGQDIKSTQFGTWFVDPAVAAQLVADRHAGRPMPWHGKALTDNLRVTWKLFQARRHPPECASCQAIWGDHGAPADFEDYAKRYAPLPRGAKRHLTRIWSPGVTLAEVARRTRRTPADVRKAIANGALPVTSYRGTTYVSQSALTRWIARKTPIGDSAQCWLPVTEACRTYRFSGREIEDAIASRALISKVPADGKHKGQVCVSRHGCAELRAQVGYDIEDAARRVGVPVQRLRTLLTDLDWRDKGRIPLVVVQNAIKRRQSACGYTLDVAAQEVGRPLEWVKQQIADGVVRVARAPWDHRRLYLTEPMMKSLRAAATRPPAARKRLDSAKWCSVARAATIAGVSTTTIIHWRERGEVEFERIPDGFRLSIASVKERALFFWATGRYVNRQPPGWVQVQFARHQVARRLAA